MMPLAVVENGSAKPFIGAAIRLFGATAAFRDKALRGCIARRRRRCMINVQGLRLCRRSAPVPRFEYFERADEPVQTDFQPVSRLDHLAGGTAWRPVQRHATAFHQLLCQRSRFHDPGEKQPFVDALLFTGGFARAHIYFFSWSRKAASLANGESGSNFGARSSRGFCSPRPLKSPFCPSGRLLRSSRLPRNSRFPP